MTTEQYSIGYEAGYQDGWDAALAEQPAEPVAWQGVYDPTDLYWRKPPQTDVRPLYTAPQPAKPAEQEPVRTEFNRVINHAIEQGFEASTFLRCWREGDWSSCKEFGFDPNTEAYTAPQPAKRVPLTPRELELIDGMIEVQLAHAERCDAIANRRMASKQKEWDMERVELLRKVRAHGIGGQE